MEKIYFSKQIEKIIQKIDFSRIGNNVGIKVHFGEKGCTTYINPEIVKAVYNKVISQNKKAKLIETNVLYKGSRTNTTEHKKTAKEHGFDFAAIDILDGEKGNEFIELNITKGILKTAKIGKGITNYDSLIIISHFKGHTAAGYGGAIKNMGMGMGSRAGKLQMHSNFKPSINKEKCTGCQKCKENCDFNAIKIENKKAEIDQNKCSGCAMCISVCNFQAVQIPWGKSTNKELQKRIAEYASTSLNKIGKSKCIFINVLENITPVCDCINIKQEPMMKDVGILLGYDPVAIDKASLDLANTNSKGRFNEINNVDKEFQIKYAEEIGLGKSQYEIEEIK